MIKTKKKQNNAMKQFYGGAMPMTLAFTLHSVFTNLNERQPTLKW